MTAHDIQSHCDRAATSLQRLQSALEWLETSSDNDEHYQMHFDAAVKRFETLFEYTWKLLKAAAEYQGVEAPGPRPAIQQAVRFGWITDPDLWAVTLDVRNGSVHDYFGLQADETKHVMTQFANVVSSLIEALRKL